MAPRLILLSLFTVVPAALEASAYTFAGTSMSTSAFTGRPRTLLAPSSNTCQRHYPTSRRGQMEMKKGKANLPPQMRGNYKQQKKMAQMRDQMMDATKPGADGLPVFNLFVRSKKTKMWYPCGSFKGDDRSASLCQSYRDGGLLSGVSKNQLDAGVSGSLAQDLPKLEDSIFRGYPQLRKSRGQLEYGYKLAYEGLSDDQQKINEVKPEKKESFLDNVKGIFGQ